MAGTSPRLSGLAEVPLECELVGVEKGWGFGFQEAVETSAVYQIGADKTGEGEWAGDGFLCGLSQLQQQEGDQGDGDLDADGVFAGAEEAGDFEGLLDPAKEQLDRPAPFVEIGDLLRRGIQVVAQDAQHFAGIELDANL